MRIDKWLWAVRQYKTRSQAAAACHEGKVLIHRLPVKASRLIQPGDEIHIKRPGLIRILKVIQICPQRLSPKLLPEYISDMTPPEILEAYKLRLTRITTFRDPGTGRPTKKERRALDDFLDDSE